MIKTMLINHQYEYSEKKALSSTINHSLQSSWTSIKSYYYLFQILLLYRHGITLCLQSQKVRMNVSQGSNITAIPNTSHRNDREKHKRTNSTNSINSTTSSNSNHVQTNINHVNQSFKIKKSKQSSPPQTVSIRGIDVHFPFTPYPNQKKYMETVINALNNSENALLESPTGTGKTLCLLCSTLAFQMEEKRGERNGCDNRDDHKISATTGNDTVATADTVDVSTVEKSSNSNDINTKKKKVPTIIYASRTHSQLSQVVKELRFTRYRPNHAVLGSREQMCIHPKVNPAKSKSNCNYISNTQSNHDVNTACTKLNKERKCRYRNNLDGFVLTNNESSSSSCSSTTISHNIQQPVLDIEELAALGQSRNICPFYLTKSQVANADIIFIPYNYLFDNEARKNSLNEINFENSIIIFDEAHNLESFASESASFDINSVDIAGCIIEVSRCIGYLQSGSIQSSNDNTNDNNNGKIQKVSMDNLIRLKNIFLQLENYIDEVLPSQGGSFSGEYIFDILARGATLAYNNYKIFLKFVRHVSDKIMEAKGDVGFGGRNGSNSNYSGTPKLDHFANCIRKVFSNEMDLEIQSIAKARSYRVHITPKSKGQGRTLSYWCFSPALSMNSLAALKVRSILVTSGTLSPLPSYSLELGLPFRHTLENEHIITKDQIMVRVVGKGVSGKELSSTYNRRDDIGYITELGNTIISLTKVIPGGVLIFFPSYSVMETCIERWGGPSSSRSRNHSYTNNNKKNFFQARKSRLSSTSTGSGRYCFPRVVAVGTNLTPWQRLQANKAIVLEPKTSAELKDVIDEFDKFIGLPKSSGCIMMGVCRGKISEGIDFADEKCRAVIITGLPFAPYLDPKVKLKREYLDGMKAAMSQSNGDGGFDSGDISVKKDGNPSTIDKKITSLSGAEWYSQQAHRAVNQAIGRVIRHRFDYGAILFLDSRYNEPRNQFGVSKWIRPYFEPDRGVGPVIGSLVKFYREAQKITDTFKEAKGITIKPTIMLKYNLEDEVEKGENKKSFVNGITKLKVIEAAAKNEATDDFGYIPEKRVIKEVQLNEHMITRNTKKSDSITASKIRNRIEAQAKNQPEEVEAKQQKRARVFFEMAQKCLSSSDFDEMRKILINLKMLGDKKIHESYIIQAKALVKILLRYDPCRFEGEAANTSDELVESLLPLLPGRYRFCIEKIAWQYRYDNSILKEECKKRLNEEECKMINLKMTSLMVDHYRNRENSEETSKKVHKNVHLDDYYSILKVILKHGTIINYLYPLLPKSQINTVRALVREYQARMRIKAMKDNDKSRYGEEGLKTALFQRPVAQNWKVSIESESKVEKSEEDIIDMKESLCRASWIKNEKLNEHQKSWEASRSELLKRNLKRKQASKDSNSKSTKISKSYNKATSIFSKIQSKAKSLSHTASDNHVDKCLALVNAGAYKKAVSKTITMDDVKSNIPFGTLCSICKNPAKQLLIAPCNHSACSDCWENWLKRSNSCPSCRKLTTKKNLAKAVYHEKSKQIPSLTQMCASSNEESDLEDELEIIKK